MRSQQPFSAQILATVSGSNLSAGGDLSVLAQAEGMLGASLGRLLAVAENYPDLKANETMQQLMEELASTENRVGFARQAFNDAVMEYNIHREKFPNFFVAGAFGFPQASQLQIPNVEARQPVRVGF
mgnify:CR=1 FL=1